MTSLLFLSIFISCGTANEFRNLNFEGAKAPLIPDEDGIVPVELALPGWQLCIGDTTEDFVRYNSKWLESPGASIVDDQGLYASFILEGRYSALLYSGARLTPPPNGWIPLTASLSQTGTVPVGTRSLRFKTLWDGLQVSLGGHPIELIELERETTYVVFGGDVSQFAGMEVELRFTARSDIARSAPFRTQALLDAVEFTPEPIPEPGVVGLLVVGGIMLMGAPWRWKKVSSKSSTPRAICC